MYAPYFQLVGRGKRVMPISMDKKYTTRDGRPVRLLCVDGPALWPVVAIIDNAYTRVFDKNGMCESLSNNNDLIEVKTKRTGWINIYPKCHKDRNITIMGCASWVCETEEMADENAGGDRIACIKIEWEE